MMWMTGKKVSRSRKARKDQGNVTDKKIAKCNVVSWRNWGNTNKIFKCLNRLVLTLIP